MSIVLYHVIEFAVVGGAVAAASIAAARRYLPSLRKSTGAASGRACAQCSGCGGCGSSTSGPASVEEPGMKSRPLTFHTPQH